MFDWIRIWWQRQTGEEETPLDGDTPAWFISLLVHLVALGLITLVFVNFDQDRVDLTITAPLFEEEIVELPQEFYFDTEPNEDIGANSLRGVDIAWAEAPNISDISDIPNPEIPISELGLIEIQEAIELATGPHFNEQLVVKGAAGVGTTGAMGAIDRITHEILLSLEERKTLVVWLFDQSGSLQQQREQIYERLDRIYEELGVVEASGNPAFKKHDDKPLLTSVIAFGKEVSEHIQTPTDNLEEIKKAVAAIDRDDSGVEMVFSAVYMAANKYKSYRQRDANTGEPKRNVMLVVFTDEVGDDQEGLEHTIKIARRFELPIYVVGVPAPFGRKETLVKWVDPDPTYDQSPQWGRVTQGPESFLPERIKLHFAGTREDEDPIDSGYGPYSLTRLCYETGGIFFAVHPNRNVRRAVKRDETAELAAHIKYFFDPQIMRKYRPDYVSLDEYRRRLLSNKSRAALVQAAQMSWVTPMESPRMRFPKRSEADLSNQLTEAQKESAKLEPKVGAVYETLKMGESDRFNEQNLRWKAGYDLAMGRVMAVKVRTESYNAMLAQAKRGMKFQNSKNDTWQLRPADTISVGSQLEKVADRAREYLERVIDDHAGTPWALLAQRELKVPLGWEWRELYTGVNAPRENAGNNNPRPPQDDQRRMLPKPKPKRKPPPL